MSRRKDYTGTRFTKLYIECQEGEKNGIPLWRCRCDCGNVVYYTSRQLQQNKPKSCGCLRSPDLTGRTFGRLTVVKRLNKRDSNHNVYYLCRCICGNTKEVIATQLLRGSVQSCGCLLDEAIQETGKAVGKFAVDHYIFDDTNVQVIERSLSGKPRTNNTSGHTGVKWNAEKQKWGAELKLRGKVYYLGRYNNIKDAIKARKRAEEEFFLPVMEDYIKKGSKKD